MATGSPPRAPIFDRQLYALRRGSAAARFSDADFLHRRAMADVVDRLETANRTFARAAFYGVGDLYGALTPACGVGEIIHADFAPARLAVSATQLPPRRVVADEEAWPFATASLDLAVSLLTLHHCGAPDAALSEMRRSLKPDGLLIAVLFGEETLAETRQAFYQAEASITGAVSPPLLADGERSGDRRGAAAHGLRPACRGRGSRHRALREPGALVRRSARHGRDFDPHRRARRLAARGFRRGARRPREQADAI